MTELRIVISDSHSGLKAVRKAVMPSVLWQRCQFHLQKNANDHVSKKHLKQAIITDIRKIFNATDQVEADKMTLALTVSGLIRMNFCFILPLVCISMSSSVGGNDNSLIYIDSTRIGINPYAICSWLDASHRINSEGNTGVALLYYIESSCCTCKRNSTH